jgi:hypothetical protein
MKERGISWRKYVDVCRDEARPVIKKMAGVVAMSKL